MSGPQAAKARSGTSSSQAGYGAGRLAAVRRTWLMLPRAVRVALVAALAALVVLWLPARVWVHRGRSACALGCHTLPSDARHASARHERLACRDCHDIGVASGLRQAGAAIAAGRSAATPHARVDAQRCRGCHEQADPGWRAAARGSGHARHASAAVACTRCHDASMHAAADSSVACRRCHDTKSLHADRAPGVPCTSCHNFAADGSPRARTTRQSCGACHATAIAAQAARPAVKAVSLESVHGSVACSLCHSPHDAGTATGRRGKDCAGCHKLDIPAQLQSGPEGHKRCEGCHEPHGLKSELRTTCLRCHEKARAAPGAVTTASKHGSCASCHKPHSWVATKATCYDCHLERAERMAIRSLAGHAECAGCHVPHGAFPDTNRCVACHDDRKTHPTAAPGAHRDCMTCHKAHEDRAPARAACAGCHAAQLGAVASGPAGHRAGCAQCHQPHGSPAAPPTLCARCHVDKASAMSGAAPAPHQACRSCHPQHRFSVPSASEACSKCHPSQNAGTGAHKGDCRSCHAAHGSPLVSQATCQRCHANVTLSAPARAPAHGRCGTCHSPHQTAKAAASRCVGCHGAQGTVAAQWKAGSAHAGPCVGCHDQHAVERKKPCGGCHAAQASSLAAGKHKACTQCHAPHQAPGGWWSGCARCHGAQSAAAARAGATHRTCSNCHKPHKFSRQSCTSCHNALRGIHTVGAHRGCASCHDLHGGGAPGRDRCLSCHRDRTAHEPNAQRCFGCHLFK